MHQHQKTLKCSTIKTIEASLPSLTRSSFSTELNHFIVVNVLNRSPRFHATTSKRSFLICFFIRKTEKIRQLLQQVDIATIPIILLPQAPVRGNKKIP